MPAAKRARYTGTNIEGGDSATISNELLIFIN